MTATNTESSISATVQLRFIDVRVDVHTNSLRLASRLSSYFRGFLATSGDPDTTITAIAGPAHYDASRLQPWRPKPDRVPKESYYDDGSTRVILKNRTGILITVSPFGCTVAGDVEQHWNQVVNLIGTQFGIAMQDAGYAMVHASAVAVSGGNDALIFLGNSGSGKTSLALQLIEQGGHEYVSNDRVLMKPVGEAVDVVGIPKKPRVNPGTMLASERLRRFVSLPRRHRYEALPSDKLWDLEDKTDVDVESALGVRWRLNATLARAYSLEWKPRGEGLHVAPLGAHAALAAMRATAKDFGCFDLNLPRRNFDTQLHQIAERVKFIRITGKADPKSLAPLLASAAL